MQIIEKQSKVLASDADISDFEKHAGVSLPHGYRSFLKIENGGSPTPTKLAFETNVGRSNSLVDWFYSLNDSSVYSLKSRLRVYQGRIPSNMIPIACDPFGNQFLMNLSDEQGAIYFWDHELENEDADENDNVYKIADSFSSFAKMFP